MFVPLCGKTPLSLVMTTKFGEPEPNQELVPPLSAWLGQPTYVESMLPWAYSSKLSTKPVARPCHGDSSKVNQASSIAPPRGFIARASGDWLGGGGAGRGGGKEGGWCFFFLVGGVLV